MPQIIDLPPELLYTRQGLWVRIVETTATVGFTPSFADGEVPDFIDLPDTDIEVEVDDDIGTFVSEWMADVFMAPLDGIITEINIELDDNPTLVIDDPYNEGWVFKMSIDADVIPDDRNGLLTAIQFEEIRHEIDNP